MSTTEVPMFTLGERMAKARQHVGLDRHQMASRLGVTERTVRNWEHESVQVARPIVLAYAAVTGVPAAWIEGTMGADTMPNTQRYSASELLTTHHHAA